MRSVLVGLLVAALLPKVLLAAAATHGFLNLDHPDQYYTNYGWMPKQASRVLRTHPGWVLLVDPGHTTNLDDPTHRMSWHKLLVDEIQSAAGDASKVGITYRTDVYRDEAPSTEEESGGFTLESTASSGLTWQDSWALTQPASEHNSRVDDFPAGISCNNTLDVDWLESLFYSDPTAKDLCEKAGPIVPDAPDFADVPILYGSALGDAAGHGNADASFNVTGILMREDLQAIRDFHKEKLLERWENSGKPELISLSCKDGWLAFTTKESTSDSNCVSPVANVLVGPAHATGDATHDPDANCTETENGILAEDTPYAAGEYESVKDDMYVALMDAFQAEGGEAAAVEFSQICAPSMEPLGSILSSRVTSRTEWIGERSAQGNPTMFDDEDTDYAPIVEAGPNTSRTGSGSVEVNGFFHDDGSPTLTWSFTAGDGAGEPCETASFTNQGTEMNSNAAVTISGVADVSGTCTYQLSADDGTNPAVTDTADLTVTATTGSITAGFTVTKPTSCYSPCGVFVDAVEDRASPKTASDDTSDEFHDVRFEWDFGDPTSGSFGTTGHSKNTTTGPLGAHVYEITEGGGNQTFNITLTATEPDGDSESITKNVNVLDPAGKTTTCVSRTSDFTDCPVANRVTDTGSAETLIEARTGERILFHTGQTWTYGSSIDPGSNTIVGPFGSGAKPVLELTDSSDFASGFALGGRDDVKVYGIEAKGPGFAGGEQPKFWDGQSSNSNTLLHDILFTSGTWNQITSISSTDAPTTYESGFIVSESTATDTNNKIIYGFHQQSAWIGNTFKSSGSHTIRSAHCNFSCFVADSIVGPSDASIITIRASDQSTTRLIQLSRNIFELGDVVGNAVAGTKKGASEDTGIAGRDFLFEGNLCRLDPTDGADGTSPACMGTINDTDRVTVRNNMANIGWDGSLIEVGATADVYNNAAFSDRASATGHGIVECSSTTVVRNNVFFQTNNIGDTVVSGTCATDTNNFDHDDLSSNPYVSADPLDFTDFQLSSPNATLIDGGYSDLGTDPSLPQLDAFGTVRPQGSAYDVGVHEQ